MQVLQMNKKWGRRAISGGQAERWEIINQNIRKALH